MTAASEPRIIQGYTLPKQKRHGMADNFRGLMAAVINRALADLKKNSSAMTSPRIKDDAMAWINSLDCETYCLILDMDYRTIREQAASLYRRFLEREEGRMQARGRPRQSGAWEGKPRPMMRPENGLKTAMTLSRKK